MDNSLLLTAIWPLIREGRIIVLHQIHIESFAKTDKIWRYGQLYQFYHFLLLSKKGVAEMGLLLGNYAS